MLLLMRLSRPNGTWKISEIIVPLVEVSAVGVPLVMVEDVVIVDD